MGNWQPGEAISVQAGNGSRCSYFAGGFLLPDYYSIVRISVQKETEAPVSALVAILRLWFFPGFKGWIVESSFLLSA